MIGDKNTFRNSKNPILNSYNLVLFYIINIYVIEVALQVNSYLIYNDQNLNLNENQDAV